MSEIRQMLSVWTNAEAAGEDWALATVVRVEGSSYRKPGTRMMLTRSGLRSGMVSGGCLEGEISRKIWWLTENGPAIQRYISSFEEDASAAEQPAYGLGCGGTVSVLMERAATARATLQALQASVEVREPSAIVTVIASAHPLITVGARLILAASPNGTAAGPVLENTLPPLADLHAIARETLEQGRNITRSISIEDKAVEVFAEHIDPPFAFFICGAGDDALPLADLAQTMGWHVTMADGRSNLVRRERFPHADALTVLDHSAPLLGLSLRNQPLDLGGAAAIANSGAVLVTHSYAQDRELLRSLLPLNLRYLGVLGPRSRTLRLVEEIADSIHLTVDDCMARLHAPVGLDLGADKPAGIALAIVAEIHADLHSRSAAPLREKAASSNQP